MQTNIETKLKNLPNSPGIYQFKDESGKVIYIGKAKNLNNRVKSYFHNKDLNPKTNALVKKIDDIQVIVTDSEMEALVLENNLIKEFKPRYNINLKDDKSFPYIKVTNEPFPQIFPTRNIVKDGSKYFGPYTDVRNMKISLRMINKIFKIRSCKYHIDDEVIKSKKIKICLDYHIKKCDGPCEGLVSQTDYKEMVNQVIKLLKGKTDDLIKDLTMLMNNAAAEMKFEKAADIRDRIEQLKVYSSKQKVVSTDFLDRDIISLANEGKDTAVSILNIRHGKLIGKKQLLLNSDKDEEEEKLYSSAITFYYNEFVEVPPEIIIEKRPTDDETLLQWLNEKSIEKKVTFTIPKRESDAKSLLNMCKQNAILQLKEIQLQKMKRESAVPHVLSSLKRDLRLNIIPKKIECFDISNLQGTDTVASMVVFIDGKPKKSLYRKFIIRREDGPNDFESMREVVERRYTRAIEEKEILPELIVIDGGKGQLSSAKSILDKLSLSDLNIIGLAKRLEEIFLPHQSDSILIPKTSSSLKLIQQIRDEAHRFAISFHRVRRDKRTLNSELDNIKGIGLKLREKLLKELGSIEVIKNTDIEQISQVIGNSKAKIVFEYFNKSRNAGNNTGA